MKKSEEEFFDQLLKESFDAEIPELDIDFTIDVMCEVEAVEQQKIFVSNALENVLIMLSIVLGIAVVFGLWYFKIISNPLTLVYRIFHQMSFDWNSLDFVNQLSLPLSLQYVTLIIGAIVSLLSIEQILKKLLMK